MLNATEDAWWRAYERGRSSSVDAAVTELQAYAADGELRPLRYEPAANLARPLGIDCAP